MSHSLDGTEISFFSYRYDSNCEFVNIADDGRNFDGAYLESIKDIVASLNGFNEQLNYEYME